MKANTFKLAGVTGRTQFPACVMSVMSLGSTES